MKSPKIHPVLVYTGREGIPGWWTRGLHVTDAAIGLTSALQKQMEVDKNTVLQCCATSQKRKRYEHKKYSYVRVFIIATALKK